MKLNTQNNFSSFWLGDTFENKSLIEKDVDTKPGIDIIKLSSYQRAISNFVNIVTAKNIPVKFSQRGDSYTDGKVVTISSKLDLCNVGISVILLPLNKSQFSPKFVFPPSFRKIIHHQTSPHMNEYVASLMVKCRKILGTSVTQSLRALKDGFVMVAC